MTYWVMKIYPDDLAVDATVYLMRYDPDAEDGIGLVGLTGRLDRAKKFASAGDVLAEWKRQSTVCPLRDDGKPNRPLTRFTIEPKKID